MLEENLRKPGEGAPIVVGKETVSEAPKVENKEDLSKKLDESEEKRRKDKAESDKKIADLQFENDFNKVTNKYPNAPELKDKIKEKVDAGIPIEDASVIVLNAEGKLITREEMIAAEAAHNSIGGSMDTQPPRGSKRPEEMTTEELRNELIKEEAKGTFKLIDN